MTNSKTLLTVTELAQREHVSRPTAYKWTRMEGFPVVRLGERGRLRVPVALFDEWIAQQAARGRETE